MNERIFDMARQSGATDEQGGRSQEVFCFTKSELSAFTELIVRECVEQIYPQWIKDHGYIEPTNLADAVIRVKEHFGVKE